LCQDIAEKTYGLLVPFPAEGFQGLVKALLVEGDHHFAVDIGFLPAHHRIAGKMLKGGIGHRRSLIQLANPVIKSRGKLQGIRIQRMPLQISGHHLLRFPSSFLLNQVIGHYTDIPEIVWFDLIDFLRIVKRTVGHLKFIISHGQKILGPAVPRTRFILFQKVDGLPVAFLIQQETGLLHGNGFSFPIQVGNSRKSCQKLLSRGGQLLMHDLLLDDPLEFQRLEILDQDPGGGGLDDQEEGHDPYSYCGSHRESLSGIRIISGEKP